MHHTYPNSGCCMYIHLVKKYITRYVSRAYLLPHILRPPPTSSGRSFINTQDLGSLEYLKKVDCPSGPRIPWAGWKADLGNSDNGSSIPLTHHNFLFVNPFTSNRNPTTQEREPFVVTQSTPIARAYR